MGFNSAFKGLKGKVKVHLCTDNEGLYMPYGPWGE